MGVFKTEEDASISISYLSFSSLMISRMSMFSKGGEKESSDIGFPASIKKFSKPAGTIVVSIFPVSLPTLLNE